MSDDNPDTLSCAWCDLPQLGWAQSAGDGRQYPSCGEVGHGIQFAPDAQIVDDLRAALVSVRAELVAANTRLAAVAELHVRVDSSSGGYCARCDGVPWPCLTVSALGVSL